MLVENLCMWKSLKKQGKIDMATNGYMREHFTKKVNKGEYKLNSCRDEVMKGKLKFFNEWLNMKLVPTCVSKKMVGWLLYMEASHEIDLEIITAKKITKELGKVKMTQRPLINVGLFFVAIMDFLVDALLLAINLCY